MAKEEKKKDEKKLPPKKKTDKTKTDKPKVQPGKKEDKKELKQKAQQLLLKHPEILNSARGLFRNENGKTIVEETVPRGDLSKETVIYPRTQGDLEEEDLRGLAVYASTLLDKTLMEYDPKVAMQDALHKAIWNKDGGKYAGRVNANTYALIMDQMGRIKKAAMEQEAAAQDPTKQEMVAFLKKTPEGKEADDFDIEAAIYWYANDYHGGQASNLYSALSTSKMKPGPTHKDVKDEGEMAEMLYKALEAEYGK